MTNPSLKGQLISLVLLVVIIPTIGINILYYKREVDRIESTQRVLAGNVVSRIALGYASMIDGFKLGRQAAVAVTLDWLNQSASQNINNRAVRSVELARLLSTIETSLPFVRGIAVYDYRNKIAAVSRQAYEKPDLWNSLEKVLPQLDKNGKERFVGPRQVDYARGTGGAPLNLYSYYLRLDIIADTNDLIILQIDISQENLQDLLQFYQGNLLDRIALFSADGIIVEQIAETPRPGVLIRAPVEGTEWFVEASLYTPSLKETGSNLRMVALLLALLIITYSATVAIIFSRSIADPVQAMAQELSEIRSGTGERRVTVPRSRELLQIAVGVNDMLDGLNLLHRKIIAHERSQHHAEIAALQAMIQPHFLFNTLETIRGLSLSGKTKAAAEAAKNLSKMMRYTIEGGDYHTTLQEELAIAKDYLAIQSLRFESRIDVTFEVGEDAPLTGAPRWILQPILENVFKHAIAPSTECVRIRISVMMREQEVIISVRDDGPGLNEEDVENINRDLEAPMDRYHNSVISGSHGLANVHHRLQLVYGKKAGLIIKSTQGEGSEITLRYPVDQRAEK